MKTKALLGEGELTESDPEVMKVDEASRIMTEMLRVKTHCI